MRVRLHFRIAGNVGPYRLEAGGMLDQLAELWRETPQLHLPFRDEADRLAFAVADTATLRVVRRPQDGAAVAITAEAELPEPAGPPPPVPALDVRDAIDRALDE